MGRGRVGDCSISQWLFFRLRASIMLKKEKIHRKL